MSKYTPGPWGYVNSLGLILSNEGKVVADPIQGVADARLIAAAPEMAELLEEAIRAIWEKGKYIFPDEKMVLTDNIKGLLCRIGKEVIDHA